MQNGLVLAAVYVVIVMFVPTAWRTEPSERRSRFDVIGGFYKHQFFRIPSIWLARRWILWRQFSASDTENYRWGRFSASEAENCRSRILN